MIAATLMVAAPAIAEDTTEWSRVSSPSESFSAEIPCNPAQIAYQLNLLLEEEGAESNALMNDPPNRVMCIMSAYEMYVATLVVSPEPTPADITLFDSILLQLDPQGVDGVPRLTQIDGRRAFVNRESGSDRVAESGYIEAGRTSVVFFLIGADGSEGKPDLARIDRFRDSIRIEAQ